MRNNILVLTLLLFAVMSIPKDSFGFCGFYVAKADTKIFNKASQVVLVRDEDKTVITMANDFKGDLNEFAVVVPVPTFIEEGQINIGDQKIIDHLDAYSAPRLVEYYDENPCERYKYDRALEESALPQSVLKNKNSFDNEKLGVTVEATYTVGEYDISILSAEEGAGLQKWLSKSGYKLPKGASKILDSYIKQKMKFFVAKVNIKEQGKLGYKNLRPIQVAYESPKFMLPIRLGTINADGYQELFVYVLNRKGRVETTNYRTVKLPTGMDIPTYIKNDFGDFYKAMFDQQVEKEKMSTVFLEYAWDMNWCDPCAADPLSTKELRDIGVFWVGDNSVNKNKRIAPSPAQNVFITRLHVRYDKEHFPEDLVFQETGDRSNFQGRYVLRHPWQGTDSCAAANDYFKGLIKRQEKEAQVLANLTGWDINKIRNKMDIKTAVIDDKKWWQKIWSN